MIGRFKRADEVNDVAARLDARARPPTRSSPRASRRACPATIVGNGAELPRFDQLAARDVFVPQPGEAWIRPRAPFRFHGVADRELVAPGDRGAARRGRRGRASRRRRTRSASVRSRACSVLDFTAFWAGPVRDRVAGGDGRRRDQGRSGAAARRHPVQRRGAPAPGPAVLREVGAVPRVEPRQARHHARSRPSRRARRSRSGSSRAATSSSRTSRRACSSSSASTTTTVRALRPDVVMLRMPAFGLTGPWRDRPGFAQTMEQLTGMAWVTGYEGGPPIIPGGLVDPMVGAHAALAIVAALEHRDAHRRGAARRGAAGRGRDRGDRRAGDPLLDRRHAARPARRGRRVPVRGRRRRGSRSTSSRDPMPADERAAWCATRTAEAAAARAARAGHPGGGDGARRTRRSTTRRCGHAASSSRSTHPLVGAQEYPTWPMRMSAGPHACWTGPAPTLGQHTDEVLRDELGIDRRRARAPRATST